MGYTNPTGVSFVERWVLLHLEQLGECHPYDIVAKDGSSHLTKRGIHSKLARLEEKGMVSSRKLKKPDATRTPYTRLHYKITSKGVRALEAWAEAMR